MGRKVHPIGFRLNVTQDWRGRWFAEGAQYREQLSQDFAIREMIYQEAGRAGVSRIDIERFPGKWHHGDWAEQSAHGGFIIHGRSDAVLNPGGVRIGTAEIYRQVEQLPEVAESIVVGQDWQGDVRVVLFVRLQPGHGLDEALVKKIRDQVRRNTTPRHVPAKILAVGDIPRTKSGKIVELAVRDVIHGRAVKNREALANPEALDLYRDRPELAD